MTSALLPPSFLFRFSVPCLHRELKWTAAGLDLGEDCRLPALGVLDGDRPFADVRAAWCKQGLGIAVRVAGKRHAVWCRESQYDDSDGLQLWIDTRDTHNIHRATRFCHRFVFLPTGGGMRRDEPLAGQLFINRAKEHPKPAAAQYLLARSEQRVDGYLLEAFIKANALTGFDPAEHPRLGFMYAVHDRELGLQTLGSGREFPFEEDPSVWATLELLGP